MNTGHTERLSAASKRRPAAVSSGWAHVAHAKSKTGSLSSKYKWFWDVWAAGRQRSKHQTWTPRNSQFTDGGSAAIIMALPARNLLSRPALLWNYLSIQPNLRLPSSPNRTALQLAGAEELYTGDKTRLGTNQEITLPKLLCFRLWKWNKQTRYCFMSDL